MLPDCCTILYSIANGSHNIWTASDRTLIGSPSGPPTASFLAFFISDATDSGVIQICSRMSRLDWPFPMLTLGPSGSTDGLITRSKCCFVRSVPMSILGPSGLVARLGFAWWIPHSTEVLDELLICQQEGQMKMR